MIKTRHICWRTQDTPRPRYTGRAHQSMAYPGLTHSGSLNKPLAAAVADLFLSVSSLLALGCLLLFPCTFVGDVLLYTLWASTVIVKLTTVGVTV